MAFESKIKKATRSIQKTTKWLVLGEKGDAIVIKEIMNADN